jgi:gluconate 5-dehydrogenase
MDSLFSIKDKVALITGSSRGIGFSLAAGLALNGATVILNGRDEAVLESAKIALEDNGISVFTSAFDITSKEQISNQVDKIENTFGRIDILVNNAGIIIQKSVIDMNETEWDSVIDTNLKGAFLVSQKVAAGMIERQSGKIINICSIQSELVRNKVAAFAASKGGMKMLTKSMAAEWGRYNIQVNGVGPGYFLTEQTQPLSDDPEFDIWLKKRTPAGRWGTPDELIGTLIYLSSEASNYVNGQIIYVDGGVLATI